MGMRKALAYSKKLEEVGLTREQAEVHLEILDDIVEDEMATKQDLKNLDSKLTTQIQKLESKLTTEIQFIHKDLGGKATTADLAKLESKLLTWGGAVAVGSVAILGGLQVWLFFLVQKQAL